MSWLYTPYIPHVYIEANRRNPFFEMWHMSGREVGHCCKPNKTRARTPRENNQGRIKDREARRSSPSECSCTDESVIAQNDLGQPAAIGVERQEEKTRRQQQEREVWIGIFIYGIPIPIRVEGDWGREELERQKVQMERDRYARNCALSASIVRDVNAVIGFPRRSRLPRALNE